MRDTDEYRPREKPNKESSRTAQDPLPPCCKNGAAFANRCAAGSLTFA